MVALPARATVRIKSQTRWRRDLRGGLELGMEAILTYFLVSLTGQRLAAPATQTGAFVAKRTRFLSKWIIALPQGDE